MPLQHEKLVSIATTLKALAHPLRLGIVYLLADREALKVTDIYTKLGIGQAEASRQLGILRRTGLLNSKRTGKNIWYSLKDRQILEILSSAERFNS